MPPKQQLTSDPARQEHLIAAPIAGDWARYNETDNRGELLGEAW